MKLIFKGILGAVTGILAGFVLGIGIWLLRDLVVRIVETGGGKGDYPGSSYPRIDELATIGMSFGAIIGSIFGSISGLKESK